MFAANDFHSINICTCTREYIMERNLTNVALVAELLPSVEILTVTQESTLEWNRSNVACVAKYSDFPKIFTLTRESTRGINHTNVHSVTNVSATSAPFSDIKLIFTATEDHITVRTVGSYIKQRINWSVTLVFTQVQSRSHVDTAQIVLHGMINSMLIYWSHTMKGLGSHVTYVRRGSATVVNSRSMYVDIVAWSLMFAANVHSVFIKQTSWKSIGQCTQTSNNSAVVLVVKLTNINIMLCITLRHALRSWDLNLRVFVINLDVIVRDLGHHNRLMPALSCYVLYFLMLWIQINFIFLSTGVSTCEFNEKLSWCRGNVALFVMWKFVNCLCLHRWTGYRRSIRPAKKLNDVVLAWITGLQRGANDWHMVQLMSLSVA